MTVGASLGLMDEVSDGASVGSRLGPNVGNSVEDPNCESVGPAVGAGEGFCVDGVRVG